MNHWKNDLPVENIKRIEGIKGGDVNDAYKIITEDTQYFLLVQKNQSEDFYAAEKEGLKDFKNAGITAPEVISSGEIAGDAYLLLTYLEEGTKGSQTALGRLAAKLHQYHEQEGRVGYSLPSDFGDVKFDNEWSENWSEFFIQKRLDVLKNVVVKKCIWTEKDVVTYASVRRKIECSLKTHYSEPSLLHGDLWGGNYMFLMDGRPALFDPAPLYGDREFDLGATRVFGGFSNEFYNAYHEAYPLEEGAEKRIQFYELYLLLLHLAKFGSMYKMSVDNKMNDILTA